MASGDIRDPVRCVSGIKHYVQKHGFVAVRILPWLWERYADDRLWAASDNDVVIFHSPRDHVLESCVLKRGTEYFAGCALVVATPYMSINCWFRSYVSSFWGRTLTIHGQGPCWFVCLVLEGRHEADAVLPPGKYFPVKTRTSGAPRSNKHFQSTQKGSSVMKNCQTQSSKWLWVQPPVPLVYYQPSSIPYDC